VEKRGSEKKITRKTTDRGVKKQDIKENEKRKRKTPGIGVPRLYRNVGTTSPRATGGKKEKLGGGKKRLSVSCTRK